MLCTAVFEVYGDVGTSSTSYRMKLLRDVVAAITSLLESPGSSPVSLCCCGAFVCGSFTERLSRLNSCVQTRIGVAAVCADLHAHISHRNRFDIEASLACAAAMGIQHSHPDVYSLAVVCDGHICIVCSVCECMHARACLNYGCTTTFC